MICGIVRYLVKFIGMSKNRKHVIMMILIICGITFIYKIPMGFFSLDAPKTRKQMAYVSTYNNTENYLINTPGCYIPTYTKGFSYKTAPKTKHSCGERAIFVDKINDKNIRLRIDQKTIEKYSQKEKFTCCYKFASRSTIAGREDTHLTYSPCQSFENGYETTLEHEVITVLCTGTVKIKKQIKKNTVIYEDAYIILKKPEHEFSNREKSSWNVLMFGLDSMSRARIYDTMPQTLAYLKEHDWLDYRGYNKVDYNTFPNLISVLTGKKMGTIYKNCKSGLFKCADYFMWRDYKKAGFVTAYGEDYLKLPDTFSKYQGFKAPPTDHYMRPFFLTGETRVGPLVCAKKRTSATQILDYAHDFVQTYKNNMFFGLFWINSYCHNTLDNPSLFDEETTNFFMRLNDTDVLNNTFIIFFSDHGTRFGEMRFPLQAYYDERLPMLFMWVPYKFRTQYEEEFYNLQVNQDRFVTPYDLYVTLGSILKMSNDSIRMILSEACPHCTSLFKEQSPHRNCEEANVQDNWCSCHNMTKMNQNDEGTANSLKLAVSHIQSITKSVETISCMACVTMRLNKVLRSHAYRDSNKMYYILAFMMLPHNIIFEVIVVNTEGKFKVISTYTLSSYNTRGNCVKDPNYRPYCVCEVHEKCNLLNRKINTNKTELNHRK